MRPKLYKNKQRVILSLEGTTLSAVERSARKIPESVTAWIQDAIREKLERESTTPTPKEPK